MEQTSPPIAARGADPALRGTMPTGGNLRFGLGVAVTLVLYTMVGVGSFGMGFEALHGDGRSEQLGPFRSVMVHLEPSQLVLGLAIGLAVAVVVVTWVLRAKPQVAAALRTCTLTVIVLLVLAATILGWAWIKGLGFGQTDTEAFSHGLVAVPWYLDVSVVTEPW